LDANYQKGLDAARRGDLATALRVWKPLAKQGSTNALLYKGLLYLVGPGEIQDNIFARLFNNLSANNERDGAATVGGHVNGVCIQNKRPDGVDGPPITASMCQTEVYQRTSATVRGPSMEHHNIIGLDIAKSVFQVHRIEPSGTVVERRICAS